MVTQGERLVALETDTKWIRAQVGTIADTVARLEKANETPHNTPAGRELLKRSDDAIAKACEAHNAALKAQGQADAALAVLTRISDQTVGIFRMFRWILAVVLAISALLMVANNFHTLMGWL